MNFGATMAAMCFFMLAVLWNQTLLGPVLRKQDLEHSGWFSVYGVAKPSTILLSF